MTPAGMTAARPDRFEMPQDGEAARLVGLVRLIVGCPLAGGYCALPETGPVGKLIALLKEIDAGARRKLLLASGACATADEIAIVNLVVEAQTGDMAACRMRALWLVRPGRAHAVAAAACVAADALYLAGVHFAPRAGQQPPPRPEASAPLAAIAARPPRRAEA